MIPDSFIEELKYVSDIEKTLSSYVSLKRRGRNLNGLCPFHSEKTPSFTVYPDTQSYYCFGCGNGGDVITFIRNIENLEYIDAIRFLAERNGLSVPEDAENITSKVRAVILEINRESARFFHERLISPEGEMALVYLKQRNLELKTIRKFGLGFAPEGWDNLKNYLHSKGFSNQNMLDAAVVTAGKNNSVYDIFRNRIIFPIIDLRGNVIGFGGRLMGEVGPKYLNTPDTLVFKKSRNLFALNFAKNAGEETIILGEGYMDVIAMHQAGFKNSVATLGTSLTSEQSRLISQYAKKVVIAYDSDNAGQNATKRAINLFSDTNISVSVLQLDGAKDPDEFISKFGKQKFENLLYSGRSAIQFEIDKLRQKYNLTITDDKISFLNDFCHLMSEISNPLQRAVHIGEIAQELGSDKESIVSTVETLRKRKYRSKEFSQSKELSTSISKSVGNRVGAGKNRLEGFFAEELLITMLMKHPDFYKKIESNLNPADFLDEGNKQVYTVIVKNIIENLPLELIYMSEALDNELISKLSRLIVRGNDITFYPEQANDFACTIKAQKNNITKKQLADMSPEDYDKYISSLRADKK